MTRDEAIETVISKSDGYACERRMAACLVDTWAAVGMLNLDETTGAEALALPVIARAMGPYSSPEKMVGALLIAGFRIIKKQ